MGDRVLFQVVGKSNAIGDEGKSEFSPVIYGHWSGSSAPAVCERLRQRMKERPGDVCYTAARLVQELIVNREGALGFGIWNADKVLTAADSHGDAGVILVSTDGPELTFQCLGGYLHVGADGLPIET